MATYYILASGTVLSLLASGGSADSHLPLFLTATLTVAACVLSHALRNRGQKL